MKKVLFSIVALLVANMSFAQQARKAEQPVQMASEFVVEQTIPSPISSVSATAVVPFWSSDFSNPADWTIDNALQASPLGWTIDATVDSWYFGGGASGPYPITSTSGGAFAELTNGDPTSSGPGVWPANVTYTMTTANPIDVQAAIGSANVTLTYEEYGARFNDLQEVQISTDGVNFTTVADNLAYSVLSQSGGSVYDNPTLRTVNIEPYINSNPSSVWVRFSWTTNFPSQASNPMVWVAYGWMIDDVALAETPANSIELYDETFGGWFLSNPSTTGDMGIPYTFNTMKQATANPYRFEGVIINKGLNNQTNTKLNVSVEEMGSTTVVYSDNSAPTTLNSGDTIVVAANSTFTPTNYGAYSCSFWASSDNVATTDTMVRTTVVTDTVYGRDYDWNYDGANAVGRYNLGRSCGGNVLANAFEIYDDATITSISFFVSDKSVANAELKVEVYEYDPTVSVQTSAPVWLAESEDYLLQNMDLGSWVTLGLKTPLSLTANTGVAYMAAVHGTQGFVGDTSVIATSGDDGVVSFIFDNCEATPTWFGLNNTLMIRMNFGADATSIDEAIFEGNLKVYPNPNNGQFTVQLSDVVADDYSIGISDVLGKVVMQKNTVVHEMTKEYIDLSSLEKGVYLLTIANSKTKVTKKVIVE